MIPEADRSRSVLIGEERRGEESGKHATSTRDVLAAAINDLRLRGIANPEQWSALGAEAINGTIRWFDAQNGRVGPGVLIRELQAGGKPAWNPSMQHPRSMLDREREYGEQVWSWLARHFPDLDRPGWGPHPAAVACVLRLHQRDGRGSVTVARHGAEIRAEVRRWVRKWGETASEGGDGADVSW